MSYNLVCFRLEPGADPQETYDEAVADSSVAAPGSEIDAAKQRLTAVLLELCPGLTHEEPLTGGTDVSLHHTDLTLVIGIADRAVTLELPTAYDDETITCALECMAAVERELGYVSYDPQAEEVLNLSGNKGEVMERYLSFMGMVNYHAKQDDAKRAARGNTKRPWWKFW